MIGGHGSVAARADIKRPHEYEASATWEQIGRALGRHGTEGGITRQSAHNAYAPAVEAFNAELAEALTRAERGEDPRPQDRNFKAITDTAWYVPFLDNAATLEHPAQLGPSPEPGAFTATLSDPDTATPAPSAGYATRRRARCDAATRRSPATSRTSTARGRPRSSARCPKATTARTSSPAAARGSDEHGGESGPVSMPYQHTQNDCGSCRERDADVELTGEHAAPPGKRPARFCLGCLGQLLIGRGARPPSGTYRWKNRPASRSCCSRPAGIVGDRLSVTRGTVPAVADTRLPVSEPHGAHAAGDDEDKGHRLACRFSRLFSMASAGCVGPAAEGTHHDRGQGPQESDPRAHGRDR
jgi:hypothetical protein